MTADLTQYESYLKTKRFSHSVICCYLSLIRKTLTEYTDEDILSKDVDEIISGMGWRPSTPASRHNYRSRIRQYKEYLMSQEVKV